MTLEVLIATPLTPSDVERIRSVDPRLHVTYRPDLIGKARFPADHKPPVFRTEAQEKEWSRLLESAEILFDVDEPSVRPDLSSRAPNLKWIQATSSGVAEWTRKLGLVETDVVVTNIAGVHAVPLAEFVVMAAMFFAKDMPGVLERQRDHRWELFGVQTLRSKTVGIVSVGRVGIEVARYCRFMGMRVLGTKRDTQSKTAQQLGIDELYSMADLHRVLGQCDYLVLSLPITDDTKGLIGQAELEDTKPGAVLINIARGAVVDEMALRAGLASGHIRGAALDVVVDEPLPPESPLWDIPNVLITGHSMSAAEEENDAIVELFRDNLKRWLEGQPMRNVIDKRRGY